MGQMTRMRTRFKKWGTLMYPDFVIAELKRTNQTHTDMGNEPVRLNPKP